MKRFFIVWSPERGNPRKAHETLAEAKDEAMRLAGKERGSVFHVLELVGTATVAERPVEWIKPETGGER